MALSAQDINPPPHAIEHGIPLLTCNRRDFADIVGLKLIAPE